METRDLIVHTALKLFIQNGYAGTSIKDITDMMGITKGALYHHYKNKDEIYLNSVELFLNWAGQWFMERIKKAESFRELLNIYFDFSDYFPEEGIEDVFKDRWTLILDAIKRFPKVRESVKKSYYGNVERIRELIDKSVSLGELKSVNDTTFLARQIVFISDGLFFYSVISGEEMELIRDGERMKKSLIEQLFCN